jgi:hypothetical protein
MKENTVESRGRDSTAILPEIKKDQDGTTSEDPAKTQGISPA